MLQKIKESADYIRPLMPNQPKIGIILGSGLGGLVDDVKIEREISYKEIPHFREWQSRTYDFFPLWKSRAEFIAIFEELDGVRLLRTSTPDVYAEIETFLKEEGYECMQDSFAANTELTRIEEEDNIYIKIGNKAINYVKLNIPMLQDSYCDESFKYVFVKKNFLGQKDEIIKKIKVFLGEMLKSVDA